MKTTTTKNNNTEDSMENSSKKNDDKANEVVEGGEGEDELEGDLDGRLNSFSSNKSKTTLDLSGLDITECPTRATSEFPGRVVALNLGFNSIQQFPTGLEVFFIYIILLRSHLEYVGLFQFGDLRSRRKSDLGMVTKS
jgi:hypothetical protein